MVPCIQTLIRLASDLARRPDASASHSRRQSRLAEPGPLSRDPAARPCRSLWPVLPGRRTPREAGATAMRRPARGQRRSSSRWSQSPRLRARRAQRLFGQLKPSDAGHPADDARPPAAAYRRSWREYRARFIEPVRINGGLEFWQDNGAELKLASALYGVPEEIIVAIIGVETIYGRNTGNFSVARGAVDAGLRLSPRAPTTSARSSNSSCSTRGRTGLDPLEPLGSYAGAIGTPQFMPGSIRRFAVDLDKDGRIDLRNSTADAIGSVASFLNRHGWVEGEAEPISRSRSQTSPAPDRSSTPGRCRPSASSP